jgi:putative hemolysin
MIELILLFVILIFLSAFFSGVESAFLTIRITRIQEMIDAKIQNSRLIKKLKDDSYNTIITLLLGNNLVNILASSLATKITLDMMPNNEVYASVVVALVTGLLTFVILVFGEITPKTYCVANAEKIMIFSAKSVYSLKIILFPFVFIFEKIAHFFLNIVGVSKKDKEHTEGELRVFVELSEEEGTIIPMQKEIIHNVLDFGGVFVKEIMTPISDVVAIDAKSTIDDFLKKAIDTNFSRIPVYKGNIENIVGVVHIKDILSFVKQKKLNSRIENIAYKISYVPSTKKISSLLKHFQATQQHMACVVNEYGNVLGVITIEDVLEELVGDIEDETDYPSQERIKKISRSVIIASGSALVDEINDVLKSKIPIDKSYETIAGYILTKTGKVPKKESLVKIDNLTIKILDSTKKRILRIRIEKKGSTSRKKTK